MPLDIADLYFAKATQPTQPLELRDIEQAVSQIAGPAGVHRENDVWHAGVCLLASAAVTGTGVNKLQKFTRYPHKFIRMLGRNWRENGIWAGGIKEGRDRPGRVVITDMDDDTPVDEYIVSFWFHAMAGLGIMKRILD